MLALVVYVAAAVLRIGLILFLTRTRRWTPEGMRSRRARTNGVRFSGLLTLARPSRRFVRMRRSARLASSCGMRQVAARMRMRLRLCFLVL